jgi:hypothetical protein
MMPHRDSRIAAGAFWGPSTAAERVLGPAGAAALGDKLRRSSKAQFNGYRRLANPHQDCVGYRPLRHLTERPQLTLAHAEAVSLPSGITPVRASSGPTKEVRLDGGQLRQPSKTEFNGYRRPANQYQNCCSKSSVRFRFSEPLEIFLTVQRDSRSVRAGAHDRWCTMREEFASNSFLAVTVAGLVLLCSGLVAFAFT